MKKTRKSIAYLLTAAMIPFTFSLSTAYAADESLPDGISIIKKHVGHSIWEYGSLDDAILKKYGENAVIEKVEKHELEKVNDYVKLEQMAFVLTEDNNIHFIYAEHRRIVTMKDGTYPPAQKVKEELDSQLNYFGQLSEDKNKYIVDFSSDSPANDILMNDENVVSIEETSLIREEYDSILGINRCVNFSYITGKTKEDFYKEYKDSLHLVYPQQHPVNGYILDGFCGIIDDSHETYEALKKLFESDVNFFIDPAPEPDSEFQPDLLKEYNKLFGETEQDVSLNAQLLLNSFNNQAPGIDIGDLNTDGSIDLTDLSELALAVIGDIELTDSQKSAADINEDGEVNVSDLARLKQFVSNSITSLR